MTTAGGPGVVIGGGGLSVNAPYTRVYAQVQPIYYGPGDPNNGTFDATGRYLHFLFQGNLNLGARSGGNQTFTNTTGLNPMPGFGPTPETQAPDFVGNAISLEFDAKSMFTLPFEGTLYLVGGKGDYKFGMAVMDAVDPRYYTPEFRFLRTVLVPPDFLHPPPILTVPNFHTFIMGVNPADTYVLPDEGNVTIQPGNLQPGMPIIPGTRVKPGNASTVLTGWFG